MDFPSCGGISFRGFTHAQKLVDCRPDTRRKAATGGTSGEFVCYLRVPISPASSEKSDILLVIR